MYFDKMPKIEYPFPDFPNLEMQDIFRRVAFTQKTLNDKGNFEQYTIVEGEKPEDIARKVYGDSRYWWLLLLSNNIIDYQNEWPRNSRELANLFENFLEGRSLFVFDNLPVKRGDVVVRRDVEATDANGDHTSSLDMNTYGVVDDYDTLLHRINLKKTRGTINTGDEIYLFRKGFTASGSSGSYYPIEGFGETGCYKPYYGATTCFEITGPTGSLIDGGQWGEGCATAGSTFSIVQRAEDIKNGAIKFRYKSDEANPYASYPTEETDANDNRIEIYEGPSGDFFSYQNVCGLTGTILYKYMTNSLSPDITTITVAEDILERNDKIRVINILDPNLLGQVLEEITLLLGPGVPRGTIKFLEY